MGTVYIIKTISEHATSLKGIQKKDFKKGKIMKVSLKVKRGEKAQYEKQERKCFQDVGKLWWFEDVLNDEDRARGIQSQKGEYLAEGQFALGSAKKNRQSLLTTKS